MAGQFSPQEQTYYNRLFDVVDKEKLGVLPGDASITFLLTSSLPQRTLGEIWALCDPNNTGYLTRDGWWKACRLIGWAQKGEQVREELGARFGAFPRFEGHDVPLPPSAPSASSGMIPQTTGGPALSPQDKTQYTRLFVSSSPVNGLLPAPQAQQIFLKSGLPTDKLAQIWNLADTQQRGSLDLPDFILAMYFIQHTMAGTIKTLPPALPAGLYEQASGGRPKPPPLPTSPIARQMTGPMTSGSPTPSMARQMTGGMQPQRTGQSYTSPPTAIPNRQFSGSAFAPQPAAAAQWDIKPEEKQAADAFFDGLDTGRRGVIEGDVAVPFMLQSGLPEGTLAQIWDLADIRKEGKLNKDEFAVAMYLINKKLGGLDPPATLPASLVPPSLRGLDQQQPQQQQQQSQTQRDLFDLFADSPPASAGPAAQAQTGNYFAQPLSVNTTGQGQGQKQLPGGTESFGTTSFGTDLMGDDEAPSPIAQPRAPPSRSASSIQPQATGPKASARDYSADIGNAKNSLDATTRAVSELEKEKAELEQKENSSAAQLKEIELRLSSVRAQHDNETRIVDDLKRRTREQTESLTKLRSELITKESELSALRAEKDETEQALLRDREEVRTMGKRMKEVQEETDTLKALLEKMKKEARQQRGMVAIAKKQVQTVEVGRDAAQKEMDDVAAGKGMEDLEEHHGLDAAAQIVSPQPPGITSPGNVAQAASIPLPATPQQALSPVATGTTSRSNNPFDRLGFGGAAFAKPPANTGAPAFPNAFATQVEQSPVEHASRDIQAPGETAPDDHELSTLEKATLGAGAAVAAVGGLAGAAVATVGSAFGIGEDTHETQGQRADVAAGGDTLHEIAQHVKDGSDEPLAPASDANTAGADTLHEIAQNVKDDAASEHSHPESIDYERQFETRATDADNDRAKAPSPQSVEEQPEDPFGMSSPDRRGSDLTPTAETPSARQNDDPFGMPATASTGGYVTAQANESQSKFDDQFESNFDQGFADDFGKSPTSSAQAPGGFDSSADFGNVTSPTADMHLAPASEPKSEFDSAFASAEKPASAVPPQLRGLVMPQMAERTDSTRAVAPSSSVGTPLSEFAPSTPRSVDTSSITDDVRPAGQTGTFETAGQHASASSAQRSFDAESSDEEDDGPEDLDRSRSPFSGGQYNAQPISSPTDNAQAQYTERSFSPPADNVVTSSASNPVPALANLGLGAPLDESHDSSSKQAFPQATDSPFSAPASTEKRRDPPPPPPRGASGSQSSNPFASFAAAPVPAPTSTVSAPFAASPQQALPTSSFDDDFDFENLPSAQVAHGQAKAPVQTSRSAVDFDDEFDDFNNDFEEIRPVSQQPAQTNNVAFASAAPQLPGFDDNFGLSKPVSAPAQPQRNAEKGFGFDDDFESAFTPAPQAQQQATFAPPPGPPPAQSQGGRPNLPARQSVVASKAQPDDLDDVKKLCNMGFDRALVIDALEANSYDFSKTLNVLLT